MQEDARISNTDLLQSSRKGCSYCWLAHYLTFIYKHHALLQRPERNQPALVHRIDILVGPHCKKLTTAETVSKIRCSGGSYIWSVQLHVETGGAHL